MPQPFPKEFKPFANHSQSFEAHGVTVENGEDTIVVFGTVDITRDQPGLKRARMLAALYTQLTQQLEAIPDLPEAIQPGEPDISEEDNPFGAP